MTTATATPSTVFDASENLTHLEEREGHDIFFRNSDRRFVVRYFPNAGIGDEKGKVESNERELNQGAVRERAYDTFSDCINFIYTRIETREKVTKTPLNIEVTSEQCAGATIKGVHGGNGSLLFKDKSKPKIGTESFAHQTETAYVQHPAVRQALGYIAQRRAEIVRQEQRIKAVVDALRDVRVVYNHRQDSESQLIERAAGALERASADEFTQRIAALTAAKD